MENANVVPTKLFKFVGITLAFIHATRAAATNAVDRDLILDGGALEFRIIDKPIINLPIINVPVLNPFAAVATTANNTTINASNPGGGQGIFLYKLPINVTLNPFENFTFQFNFDGTITLSNTLDVSVYLQGLKQLAPRRREAASKPRIYRWKPEMVTPRHSPQTREGRNDYQEAPGYALAA